MQDKPKWFEKTVEYHYVRYFLNDRSVIAPLDGNAEEAWGDLIDSSDAQYRLIEFKRSVQELNSELGKYANPGRFKHFTECVATLKTHQAAKAHWLVFGETSAEDGRAVPVFRLRAWPYVERESERSFVLVDDQKMERVSKEAFGDYLVKLSVLISMQS